jgi:serine/threonine protein kinase
VTTRGAEGAFQGTSRYEVQSRIGDGGGGVVYRAFDRTLGHDVALKVLHDAEGEEMARFRAGFASLRQVRHPNLVTLFDLSEEGGRWLLSMELIEGTDLLQYVRREEGGFDELRLRGTFSQLAQGLRALHHERKVHRDVKPANIRVTHDGRVVLLDLDLSVDVDEHAVASEDNDDSRPVGTAAYMAPEQAISHLHLPAGDWYSMGVVLYEALTGTLPYRGSDLEILLAKQDERPLPPSAYAANLPADLESLCVDLLVPDARARPSGAQILRRLGVHEEVVSGRLSLASLLSGRPPFIGREPELARLFALVDKSRERAIVVRVTGEAGVGKTTLCEELMQRLLHDSRHAITLSSACPRYPDRPHAPVHVPISRIAEALRQGRSSVKLPMSASALRLLERAFAGAMLGIEPRKPGRTTPAPDPLEQRWRAISALRALFAEAASQRPVVWWIDNYQWADVDTQRLIASLIAGADAPRMLIVLSDEPEPGMLQSSEPAAHEVVTLARLTPVESRKLAERLVERATGQISGVERALYRDGLPLMIHERMRYSLFFGEPPADDASISELYARRLKQLSPSARRVLDLLCAAHDPIPQEVCERASELGRAEFSRQLSALRVGGLVRGLSEGGEDMLVPAHPLVAECVDLELHGEARVQIHGRLAVALVARDPARASGRLLRHQGESGDHVAAAQSARVAAEQAHDALAFQRAAELFTLCASLDPPNQDEDGYRLLKRMADALAHAGWALQAATIYREAALGAKVADAMHMRQRAAEHLLRGAEIEEGLEALRELLASIDMQLPRTPNRALWSIAARRALLGLRGLSFKEVDEGQISARDLRRIDVLWSTSMQLGLVDVVRGGDFMARGLTEALKAGEPHRVARALCTEAWTMVGLDRADLPRTHAVLDSAHDLVERLGSPLLDGHLRLAKGMVAFGTHRLPECGSHCRDAERVFRDHCADVVWEVTTAQVYQLIAMAQMAQYEELGSKLERCMREAGERGDVWGYTYFMSIGAMSIKLARDLPNEAAENAHEALARWASGSEFHFQHLFGLVASAYIELYRESPAALDRLDEKWPELKKQLFLRVRFARTTLLELRGRARVLAARKRKDPSLLKLAQADARTLLHERDPVASGFAHLINASVHRERGDEQRAVEQLRLGIPYLESFGLDLWVPSAKLELGRLLGGDEGRRLERDATAAFKAQNIRNPSRFVAMLMPGFMPR